MSLDTRRWFNRSLPQTLQIACILLYLHAVFGLIGLLSDNSWEGFARVRYGAFGALVVLALLAAAAGGAFLMANDRRIGYYLGFAGSLAPFIIRFWVLNGTNADVFQKFTGGSNNVIGFLFEAAVVGLLVHPMSRDYQRIWFK